MTRLDHGELNIPNRTRNLDAEIRRNMKRINAENRAKERETKARRKAERKAEKSRAKLTRDDVVGARLIRDKYRWYEVVRVNAKTVTYRCSVGELRMPFDQILEVRK